MTRHFSDWLAAYQEYASYQQHGVITQDFDSWLQEFTAMPRNFDNWLREYQIYTQHSEAPDLFHFWVGVSTIAGALRRRVWIDQRYFQWTPNFYIVFVAPAGIATKSTSIRIGLKLLEEIEGIKFGPQSLTWQALTKALKDAEMGVPYEDGFIPMSCITCAVSELSRNNWWLRSTSN